MIRLLWSPLLPSGALRRLVYVATGAFVPVFVILMPSYDFYANYNVTANIVWLVLGAWVTLRGALVPGMRHVRILGWVGGVLYVWVLIVVVHGP